MRSILITAGVFAVLVVAFVVFLLTQNSSAPVARRTPTATSMPAPTQGNSDSPFGGGEGGWVQSFDKKSGELASEFRAEHFDPPVDNVVHVTKPEARFYGKDGQVLTLAATDGDITMAETAKRQDRLGSMQTQPPSHGILRNVTLGLLETPEADVPVLVATLPIVAFDNDTLRLNTVPLTEDGKETPADQVPVTVRGRDYDFDGQGLTIRYNQRDRRLEFLEIAHGKRLVIKNPKTFGGQFSSAGPLLMDDGRPIELADADPTTAPRMTAEERERRRLRREAIARRAATQAAATKPARELFAYTATFSDNVKIKEADAQVGSAEQMTAIFTFDTEKHTATQPTTQLIRTQADTAPVVAPSGSIAPATRPARRTHLTQSTTQAVVQPTSRPVRRAATSLPTTGPAGPVEITWSGKLTVIPTRFADSGLISASDRIVKFTGKPVTLQREGATIVAAYIWAALEGDRFNATPDETTPQVTLTDVNGTKLVTESIESDGVDAVLHGKSQVDLVMAGDEPAKPMHATWNDLATIRMTHDAAGKRGIERAVFRGAVNVDHPQLKLNSDTLTLGFASAEAGQDSTLSAVRADGKVKAAVTKEDGSVQTINAGTLELKTEPAPGGAIAVRTLHAHGDVVAHDPQQVLKTDDLDVTLAAKAGSTQPSDLTALEKLTATGRVNFVSAQSGTVKADRLTIEQLAGQQWITVTGTPASLTNADASFIASGNTIRADAAGSAATIEGPGRLIGLQENSSGKPGQPLEVSWTKAMVFDGSSNRATIQDDVVVTTLGNDGSHNFAKGRTLDITFASSAGASPATQQVASPLTGTGKQIKSLTLHSPANETVELSSLLYAANDASKVIRRTFLYVPTITVDVNADGSPGAMKVPAGGQMLYEDVAPAQQAGPAGNGTIAMEWKKSLSYDPAKQQAVLDGDVAVVRQVPNGDRMELRAPKLVADVIGGATPQGLQLQKVTADNATMQANQVSIDAPSAVFDPGNNRLIAKGTPRQPVQLHEERRGMSRGSFGEIWWNLKTNQPEKLINVSAQVNQ